MAPMAPMVILHILPRFFPDGAGESQRHVHNICRAVTRVSSATIQSETLSFAVSPMVKRPADGVADHVLLGDVEPAKLDSSEFIEHLAATDVVHIHNCLSRFGLHMAAHSKLNRKIVIGTDYGAENAALLSSRPQLMELFDLIVTPS